MGRAGPATREPDLCLSDAGFEVDLTVRAELAALTRVYLGQVSLGAVLGSGSVQLSGPRQLRSGFRDWIGISPFAQARPRRKGVTAAS